MICSNTGLPHVGDPCVPCAALEARLAAARSDPRYLAATALSDVAFRVSRESRHLPFREWLKRVEECDAAGRVAGRAFSHAYGESTLQRFLYDGVSDLGAW